MKALALPDWPPLRSVALVGTGGSSGRTLSAIEEQLRILDDGLRCVFIDTQPFNLRSGGLTHYPGNSEVRIANMADAGMRRFSGSWSLNMLANGGPIMARKLVAYGRKLLGGKHDAVIMCHDRIYIETAIVAAAKADGTPTVMVQEGPFCAIGPTASASRSLKIKSALAPIATRANLLPEIPEYGFAGHRLVLASSGSYRQRWIDAGLDGELVKVSGVPRYDALARLKRREPFGAGSTATSAKLKVLYLFQPFGAHGKVEPRVAATLMSYVALGLNAALQHLPIEFTVRLHPRSKREDAAALFDHLDSPCLIDQGSNPLEEAVLAYDLIVGHYSSGLLESILLDRPVLCVPVPMSAFSEAAEADKQAYLVSAQVPVARSEQEVAEYLANFRIGSPVSVDRACIDAEVGVIDGLAARRCAEAVLDLIAREAAT